jgi:hypothetical protein
MSIISLKISSSINYDRYTFRINDESEVRIKKFKKEKISKMVSIFIIRV